MDLLKAEVAGNSLLEWAIAAGALVAMLAAIWFLRWLFATRIATIAARTSFTYDDAVVDAVRATRLPLLLFPVLVAATRGLDMPPRLDHALSAVATLAAFMQIGLWLSRMLSFVLERSRERATDAGAATSLVALLFIGRILLWSILLLLALDNLGIDVTAAVAGLGIGGVAVALAVQNILGDLFASLSIIVDRPFVLGDFVIVEDYMGTVENIGLKTTRLRSLGGEQLIFSNSDLLKSRLRNYKRMNERRVLFSFGVTYDTPLEMLQEIPTKVREIVESLQTVRFERAHFQGFGDSSLNFEVVYWALDPDFNLYMDRQQTINLELVRYFRDKGIEFAFPTRTVILPQALRVEGSAGALQPAQEGLAGGSAPMRAGA
jgi:small-conductance mechanosensitive channel